jgi:hypothetical protein
VGTSTGKYWSSQFSSLPYRPYIAQRTNSEQQVPCYRSWSNHYVFFHKKHQMILVCVHKHVPGIFQYACPKKSAYNSHLHMKPQNCFVWNPNLQFCRKIQSLLRQYGFVTGSVNLSIANLIYRWDSLNGHVNIQNNRYLSAYTPNTEVKLTEIINHSVSDISSQKLNSVFNSLFVVKHVSELNVIISNTCSIRQQIILIRIL